MNVKQLKWIYKKALRLIEEYEGRKLDSEECAEIVRFGDKVYQDSKKNEYCKNIMLDVISALSREELNRSGEANKRV